MDHVKANHIYCEGFWACSDDEQYERHSAGLAAVAAAALAERTTPLTDEVFNGVTACVKAMKRLDAGQTIDPGSPEHLALTWGVLKLVNDNLIDHSPLTGDDLAYAQEVARKSYQTG